MKRYRLAIPAFLMLFVALAGSGPLAAAQINSTGALQFDARVVPADGQIEPVRQLSFYLLRKSLKQIEGEVSAAEPALNMDSYVDGLDISAGLKTWMKKTQTVEFTGLAFSKVLGADDVMDIPEFFEAYRNLNGAVLNKMVTVAPAKESDRLKNPQKYERDQERYRKAMQQYIKDHPQMLDGLDAELTDRTFGRRWMQLQNERKRRVEQRALILAQTQYLAAKTESDLNGRGEFRVAPGNYWITTLNIPALAGADRLEWDLRVTVRAGETSHIDLSNLNALSAFNSSR